jgi:hypothetical protein
MWQKNAGALLLQQVSGCNAIWLLGLLQRKPKAAELS